MRGVGRDEDGNEGEKREVGESGIERRGGWEDVGGEEWGKEGEEVGKEGKERETGKKEKE